MNEKLMNEIVGGIEKEKNFVCMRFFFLFFCLFVFFSCSCSSRSVQSLSKKK